MMLLLLALLDWFSFYQYTPKALSLRGCSECRGEPDDLCEVRAGAQARRVDDLRRAPEGRVYLIRSKGEPDCAVASKALARSTLDVVAARISRATPSPALLERAGAAVKGWPRAPQRRKAEAVAAAPQRSALRLSLLCWPSPASWPLDASTLCEWWLLPMKDGEPDVSAPSFPLQEKAFTFGAAPWAKAFDPSAPLDESTLIGQSAAPAEPAPPPPAVARCGDAARARTAMLERFEQWEQQIRGARRSLDPASWTLNAAAWSGHCQEMDVLRGALEEQLGCAISQEGRCASP